MCKLNVIQYVHFKICQVRSTTSFIVLQIFYSFYNESILFVHVLRILQITSSEESLLPHCHYYKDATETNTSYVCLRLQNLSLSRMGSIKNLLWVQMLDLSHNELRSLEGKTSIINNFAITCLFPPLKYHYDLALLLPSVVSMCSNMQLCLILYLLTPIFWL
jgi:hypothetical protein